MLASQARAWFADTMLDARADAARQGKRLMLYFWQRGFVAVGVNVRGDREIAWTDGAARRRGAAADGLRAAGGVRARAGGAQHCSQGSPSCRQPVSEFRWCLALSSPSNPCSMW